MDSTLQAFGAIIGARNLLTDSADMAPYLKEWRDLFTGKARAVARPSSTAQVAALLALAHETGTPIVPQGGNTGLVGGQIPVADGREIILSLGRMDKVRSIDPVSDTIIVEAGVTLSRVQDAADGADRLFPLSLASEGSCTIGGNLSTNAGGTAVLAYGNSRDLCLGLEVVLADGRIWNGLRTLRKDNTGYDLKNLFIGAEGTLGVITAASLKLFPKPRARATAFLAVDSPDQALSLLHLARAEAGQQLTTFEIMPRFGIEVVLRHAPGTRDPLAAPSPWYVLMELSSPGADGLDATVERLLEAALDQGVISDAVLAASESQRQDLWRIREAMSEVQRFEGGSIKHDVSVPVAAVPDFLAEAIALVIKMIPGCRPLPFGHLGDGNIHFNITQPEGADKAAFLARWDEINAAVHAVVANFQGSISAEHGIGRLKRHLLPGVKDPVELALMRAIKATLDPTGILNPGAVL
ncbi:MAG: FAD-binding oxidoreductase [Hyphomicrobiales bacterium]|nr:FAD-binding oxidoreductase [Hyphomicrobiales bacterium]